jgi:hypothetical protein
MTTLSDWLPLLQSEHGDAICEAAGISFYWLRFALGDDDDRKTAIFTDVTAAALAFGTLAVLSDRHYPEIVEDGGRWRVLLWRDGNKESPWAVTLPEAVRLAAMRAWNIEPTTPGGE